jgi:hypothetical protein
VGDDVVGEAVGDVVVGDMVGDSVVVVTEHTQTSSFAVVAPVRLQSTSLLPWIDTVVLS